MIRAAKFRTVERMCLADCLRKRRGVRYTACKPNGPVLQNAILEEVAAPTYKRGFVTPKFRGLVRLRRSSTVSGGMGRTVTPPARLLACFEHPAHLLRFKSLTVDSLDSPEGIQTMTATHNASLCAASATSGETALIQLHADAHNALSMAVFYLRQPQANVPGARRKAVQALAALRNLTAALEA